MICSSLDSHLLLCDTTIDVVYVMLTHTNEKINIFEIQKSNRIIKLLFDREEQGAELCVWPIKSVRSD